MSTTPQARNEEMLEKPAETAPEGKRLSIVDYNVMNTIATYG
mgnify:FL=1